MEILAHLITLLTLALGAAHDRGVPPEADRCLTAMAQTITWVPMRCAPEAMASAGPGTASGEYYDGSWEPVNGLPEEVVIYYTAEQATVDPAAVEAYHRTVIAHELGHSWWMTHATDAQRAEAQRILGWSYFSEEAAADVFAMAATTEWRDYWGRWEDQYPGLAYPTPEALLALDEADVVPELGSPFASFVVVQ